MGYFRDDQPLYELILDDAGRKELDALWLDLDFVADATARTYRYTIHNHEVPDPFSVHTAWHGREPLVLELNYPASRADGGAVSRAVA